MLMEHVLAASQTRPRSGFADVHSRCVPAFTHGGRCDRRIGSATRRSDDALDRLGRMFASGRIWTWHRSFYRGNFGPTAPGRPIDRDRAGPHVGRSNACSLSRGDGCGRVRRGCRSNHRRRGLGTRRRDPLRVALGFVSRVASGGNFGASAPRPSSRRLLCNVRLLAGTVAAGRPTFCPEASRDLPGHPPQRHGMAKFAPGIRLSLPACLNCWRVVFHPTCLDDRLAAPGCRLPGQRFRPNHAIAI